MHAYNLYSLVQELVLVTRHNIIPLIVRQLVVAGKFSKNKRYLWGTYFYWLCDCKPMWDILKYDGDIAIISQ